MNGSAASGLSFMRDEAALELDVVGRLAAEDGGPELLDLAGEHVGGALDGAQAGDGELARVRAREAGVGVPVAVVARADVARRRE